MSLDNLFSILKGGAGSGNWGHAGNPPEIGGSSPGGGLGKLGLDKSSTVEERRDAKDKPVGKKIETKKFNEISSGKLEEHYDMDKYCIINPIQCDSLSNYTDLAHERINKTLRSGQDITSEIRGLDSAFVGAKSVPEDMIVRRVVDSNVGKLLQEGSVFQDKGFVSTTIHKNTDDILKDLTTFGGVNIEIRVPKGTKGIYIDSISANPGEKELLLNRGLNFNILSNDGKNIIAEVVDGQEKK